MRLPAGLLDAFAPGRAPAAAHEVLGEGHIHLTVRVRFGGGRPLVLQRLNEGVFEDLEALEANTRVVAGAASAAGVLVPRTLPSTEGARLWRDEEGAAWRAYEELPGRIEDPPSTDAVAERVATAVGRFDAALRAVEPRSLAVVISRFHDLEHRVAQLEAAASADAAGRLATARRDLDSCSQVVERLRSTEAWAAWQELPVRIAHNDAKAGNVVLHDEHGDAVIDLDTVMPGTVLADVGELVRSATRSGGEDAGHPVEGLRSRVGAVVSGFQRGWAEPFTEVESAALPVAGAVMALENAVRFLTDHLAGDVYFRVRSPGQNLDRHRTSLRQASALLDLAGG